MANNMELRAVITADDNASKTISKVGGAFNTLAKVGIAGAIAGVAALTYGLKKCVDAASEAEDVMAQTNAVLKSTNGIAGVTSKQVTDLASSLQKVTRFSDETVQSGENLLLTFTNIGKDVFPEATEVMLDMSQALGQDVKSSAIQLGKALQDPILGVTALRRVGVNFNEEAKKTIEKLVDENKLFEAQKFILKELQTEFGGAARAAGTTFAGQIDILRNRFSDMQETIGKALITALIPFVQKLADWAATEQAQVLIATIATKVGELATKMLEFITNVAIPWVQVHWPAIRDWINYVIDALKGLDAMDLTPITLAVIALGVAVKGIPGVIAIAIAVDLALIGQIRSQFQGLRSDFEAIPSRAERVKIVLSGVVDSLKTFGAFGGIGVLYRALSGRASGGPVTGNKPYIVGEQGPEVFVPSQSGTIIPNNITNSMNVNIYGNINNQQGLSPDEVGRTISRQIDLSRMGAF